MDETIIIHAFIASLTQDNEARAKAQEYLTSIQSTKGLIPIIINIALSDSHFDVKQLASIFLKNLTKV